MHISLGVLRDDFPISMFLRSRNRKSVTISTVPLRGQRSGGSLTFVTNPDRRGGEWIIRDQRAHRHPAWSERAGFPKTYKANNPPYILVFRVGNNYHAQYSSARQLAPHAPQPMLAYQKGILPTTRALLRHFGIGSRSTVEVFQDEMSSVRSPPFDPKNIEDGRRLVERAIRVRQGQQGFRRKLLKAYGAQCALTRERAEPVLEAAHITPYLGPKTNATANGLLLRADIHTLFDLALISIDPDTRKVKVSKSLKGTPYAKLHGKRLAEPHASSNRPSTAALREHFSGFLP